jgi:hypothetical protein
MVARRRHRPPRPVPQPTYERPRVNFTYDPILRAFTMEGFDSSSTRGVVSYQEIQATLQQLTIAKHKCPPEQNEPDTDCTTIGGFLCGLVTVVIAGIEFNKRDFKFFLIPLVLAAVLCVLSYRASF